MAKSKHNNDIEYKKPDNDRQLLVAELERANIEIRRLHDILNNIRQAADYRGAPQSSFQQYGNFGYSNEAFQRIGQSNY